MTYKPKGLLKKVSREVLITIIVMTICWLGGKYIFDYVQISRVKKELQTGHLSENGIFSGVANAMRYASRIETKYFILYLQDPKAEDKETIIWVLGWNRRKDAIPVLRQIDILDSLSLYASAQSAIMAIEQDLPYDKAWETIHKTFYDPFSKEVRRFMEENPNISWEEATKIVALRWGIKK